MSSLPREVQRDRLHRTIWEVANELRGAVDGWDFKSYVLGMLFYRFISENLASFIEKNEGEGFSYASLTDEQAEPIRDMMVDEKGFFILPSQLFVNVRKRAAQDENLNETLEKVFQSIEGSSVGQASEDDLKGLFNELDVNSPRLGNTVERRNEKLRKLLNAIGDLDMGERHDEGIDMFGDAYEFLMQMYASQAGKSGGEYYTPQEVSELLTRLTVIGKTQVQRVYETFTPRLIQVRVNYELAASLVQEHSFCPLSTVYLNRQRPIVPRAMNCVTPCSE